MNDDNQVSRTLKRLRHDYIYVPSKGMFIFKSGRFKDTILGAKNYKTGIGKPRCYILNKRINIATLVWLYETGKFVRKLYHKDGNVTNTCFDNLSEDQEDEFSDISKIDLVKLKFDIVNNRVIRKSISHKSVDYNIGHETELDILVRLNHYDRIPMNDIAWILYYGEEPDGFVYNKNGDKRDVSKDNLAIGLRPDKRYKDPMQVAQRHKPPTDVISMASIKLR